MIIKILTVTLLAIFSTVTLAHPGHGTHIEFITADHLQQIFDISGFLLLMLSMFVLRLYRVKK